MKKLFLFLVLFMVALFGHTCFAQTSPTRTTTCTTTSQTNSDNSRTFTSRDANGNVISTVRLSEDRGKLKVEGTNFSNTPKVVSFSGNGYLTSNFSIPANGTLNERITDITAEKSPWIAVAIIVALCVDTGYNSCDGFYFSFDCSIIAPNNNSLSPHK